MLREDANPSRRRFWIDGLMEAQQAWVGLRDLECGRVAQAEAALPRDPYEARLLCLMRENEARRRLIEARFPKSGS